MDNKQKHLYTDYICVIIMLIGAIIFAILALDMKHNGIIDSFLPFVIGFPIILCGLLGMYLNEKLNPFGGKNGCNNI